jgi:hypothetical protein
VVRRAIGWAGELDNDGLARERACFAIELDTVKASVRLVLIPAATVIGIEPSFGYASLTARLVD